MCSTLDWGWELYALGSAGLITQVADLAGASVMIHAVLDSDFLGADFSCVAFDVRIFD